MPPTSEPLSFAFLRTAFVALTVACHQSSGLCSAQPERGWVVL